MRSRLSGYWFDPVVVVGDDEQTFERGVRGRRYLNLSGQAERLRAGELVLRGRHCELGRRARLFACAAPAALQQPTLIIAPHADAAELAAFGLYRELDDVSIVTLTQGELEAEYFQRLGLAPAAAARLKGRLRAWDSLATPLWGGVPQQRCVQLGYYCMQLGPMAAEPAQAFPSRINGDADIRSVRQHNPLWLPGDADGVPSWVNLVADLRACIEHFRPVRILLPHPELDPHADHVATGRAVTEALQGSAWQPRELFFYANHLHDNDRWPMGAADTGVALPPALVDLAADHVYCHLLDDAARIDKAMVLRMQHDLQTPLPLKRRLRRLVQQLLCGRRWPASGENEYLRRAVRRHELFWVRPLTPAGEAAKTATQQPE